MPDNEVVAKFPACGWSVEGKAFTFGITSIEETYRNRLVDHERVYREGARLDDTGSKATVWTIVAEFYNQHDEPGIGPRDRQYPDRVDAFTDSLKIHETGTLKTPTRGPRRARLESYTRSDEMSQRDFASVTLVFWEDNEDDAKQQSFNQVSGAGAARKAAEDGTGAAEAEGAGGGFDMSDLNEFAGELEALANAPGDFVDDIDAKANAIGNKVESIEDTFTTVGNEVVTEVKTLLTKPEASLPLRRMRKTHDVAKGIAQRKAAGQIAGTTTVTFPRTVSIFDVATKFGQPSELLIALNGRIEDVMNIPADTPITIFDTPAVRNAKGNEQDAEANAA